jgi:uncharacterized protein (TIGR02453 family)
VANTTHITPELFRFFRQLKRNNNREWFLKNKSRYEDVVRYPLLELVSDFAPRLHAISPYLVADPRPSGGSLFRIYRDVRFSKDKTPYKTAAGIRFPHESANDVHAPGYYLHLEPGDVFAGAGIWRPESATLRKVRDAIVSDPKGYKRSISGRAFKARCELGGESLKRSPKGYDPDHPLIDELKRKDFIAFVPFTEKQACAKDFTAKLAAAFRAMAPFNAYLTRALGAPW